MCCCCRSFWFCCCWCKVILLDKVKFGVDKVCFRGRCIFNCFFSCEDVNDVERFEFWGDNKLFCFFGGVDIVGGDVVGGIVEFNFKCCFLYFMDNICVCVCVCVNVSCFYRVWCSVVVVRLFLFFFFILFEIV